MLSFTTITKLINDYELYNKSVYNDPLVRPMIDILVNKMLRDVHQVTGTNLDQVLNINLNLSDNVKKLIIEKVIGRFQLENWSQTMLPLQIVSKFRILNIDSNETHFLVSYNNNTVQIWNISNLTVEYCLDHDLLDNLVYAKFEDKNIITYSRDNIIVKWTNNNHERILSYPKFNIKKELTGHNFRIIACNNKLTIYKFDYLIGLIRLALINSQHDSQKLEDLTNSDILTKCDDCELVKNIKLIKVF